MQTRCLDRIRSLGGIIDDVGTLRFQDAIAEAHAVTSDNCFAPLVHWSAIAIEGPDAQTFLSGQLLSDVRTVDSEHGQATGWCSPKGRVLMNGYLVAAPAGYFLFLPRAVHSDILRRLAMYVLRAKVKLRDATDECALTSYVGAGIPELLQQITAVPSAAYEAHTAPGGAIMRLPGLQPRWLAWSQLSAVAPFAWQQMVDQCTPIGSAAWDLQEIIACRPMILPATREAFLPQMLNMDYDGSVSFTKGCYPGQEIIARLQYRGEVKRRLFRAQLPVSQVPPPMTAVLGSTADPENPAGNVINAAPNAMGGVTLLAVLDLAVSNTSASQALTVDGCILEVTELAAAKTDSNEKSDPD